MFCKRVISSNQKWKTDWKSFSRQLVSIPNHKDFCRIYSHGNGLLNTQMCKYLHIMSNILTLSLCFFVLDDQKKLATIDDLVAKLDETSTFDKLAEKLEYSYRKTAVRWHSWIKYWYWTFKHHYFFTWSTLTSLWFALLLVCSPLCSNNYYVMFIQFCIFAVAIAYIVIVVHSWSFVWLVYRSRCLRIVETYPESTLINLPPKLMKTRLLCLIDKYHMQMTTYNLDNRDNYHIIVWHCLIRHLALLLVICFCFCAHSGAHTRYHVWTAAVYSQQHANLWKKAKTICLSLAIFLPALALYFVMKQGCMTVEIIIYTLGRNTYDVVTVQKNMGNLVFCTFLLFCIPRINC